MPAQTPASASQVIALFQPSNAGHNILIFNFHDQAAVAALPWGGMDTEAGLSELKALQRMMRLHPDWAIARALLAAGLDSAHAIAAMSEDHFVRRHQGALLNNAALARAIHHKAVDVKQRTALLWASVKDMVAAPHYRATLFNNVPNALTEFYRALPSYQDLFGSLDYCQCDECRSILSPAAYFVDLMRLVEEYVTTPNQATIPPGFSLQARRPDLFDIPLDCEHTNTLVPYLQIVNTVMESKLSADLGVDAFEQLAISPYPFNLPFHLPLVQIRSFLEQFKTELAVIYDLLKIDQPQVHREQLKLSIEAADLITTPHPDAKALSADYGLQIDNDLGGLDHAETFAHQTGLSLQQLRDLLYQNLGQQEILDVTGTYALNQAADDTLTLTQTGNQVRGAYGPKSGKGGSLIGIIEGNLLRGTWSDNTPSSTGNVELAFTADGSAFAGQLWPGFSGRGKSTAWSGTRTGAASTSGVIPHSFFINQGFTNPQTYLGLAIDKTDPQNPFERITNLNLDTLDRMNRFIRLANTLQWSFADLDWALKSVEASAIDGAAITSIASIKKLQNALDLPLDVLCSFWHDIKTSGVGDGNIAHDLFDRVFNQPTVFYSPDNQKHVRPYHPADPNTTPYPGNPLYIDQPLAWDPNPATASVVGAGGDPIDNALIRSRMLAALSIGDDDLTQLANHLVASGQVGTTTGSISLTVSNLSQFYRFSKLSHALGLSIGDYLLLLELLPKQQAAAINYPGRAIQDVLAVVKLAEWLKTSGLNVSQLHYITTGQLNAYVDPGYRADDVKPMLADLRQQSQPWLVQTTAFVHEDLDEAQSEAIFRQLIAHGLIDGRGVLLDTPITFQALATLARLTGTSFVTDLIDATASQKAVFDPLRKKGIINSHWFLASSFNDTTDLSFLFAGDVQQDDKIEQVRAILLQIQVLSSSGIAVQDSSFITDNINLSSSKNIFEQLLNHRHNIIDKNGFFVAGLRLFSTNLQFNTDLNQGKLPESLRQLFLDHRLVFSDDVVVVAELKGRRWRIVDQDQQQEYTLKYEKKQLNVYGSFNRNTDLSFLIEELNKPSVIPTVQSILVQAQQNITFIWGRLAQLLKLQQQGIIATLAGFFDAETALLQAALDIAIRITSQQNDLALLLTPFEETAPIPPRSQRYWPLSRASAP